MQKLAKLLVVFAFLGGAFLASLDPTTIDWVTFLPVVFVGAIGVRVFLKDKDSNNEPLPFANVFIKNTTIGTTTTMDGNYTLSVPVGKHTLVFSFIGYETIERQVVIVVNKTLVVHQVLSTKSGVVLDEIKIVATKNNEKESILLFEQRKAKNIKESIGAQRLSKIGISNASGATSKISGVSKSERSGNIYIRGLGDRYLSTTMNGLPIPSDNVEDKNINLNLFSTNIIKNIGVSKTYETSSYADQASGNVNISSKSYIKNGVSISIRGGANTNVINTFKNFRRTIISDDVTFGFHQKKYALVDLITKQGWDTKSAKTPINFSINISGGKKFYFFEKELSVFVSGSHSKTFSYENGLFKSYRSNILDKSFTNVETFKSSTNTTGYANLNFKINTHHKINTTTLFVAKGDDVLYEQGRNGLGFVFDQDPQEDGAFVRDQNYKQTIMFINQWSGKHVLNKNNTTNWATGYNYALSEEPNRIRNEVSILNSNTVQFAHVGDFQQRKSSQKIEDSEFNTFLTHQLKFGKENTDGDKPYLIKTGFNIRKKERNFNSLFIGVRAKDFQITTVDSFSETFTDTNFNNGLVLKTRDADRYIAHLNYFAGFISIDFDFEKFTGNIGARYETNKMDVTWDVANFVGRAGALNRTYNNMYPSLNLKYELSEKNYLRFATSLTQTLPEFKELSPFEYVSPTGRVTKGNPNLEKSKVLNLDLKWEYFPSRKELISTSVFYKQIQDPINLAQARGSSGNFVFFNTGKLATAYGIEFETRVHLLKNQEEESVLNFNGNLTKMWLTQDLLPDFQYKGLTTSNLQGASDFIVNGSLSYTNRKERELIATLSGTYASGKIFALGSPEDFANSDTFYNDEIIEKGFVNIDFVLSKKLTEKLTLKFIGKNITNPEIKQTQYVKNINTGIETNNIVSLYKKGSQLSLSLKYEF